MFLTCETHIFEQVLIEQYCKRHKGGKLWDQSSENSFRRQQKWAQGWSFVCSWRGRETKPEQPKLEEWSKQKNLYSLFLISFLDLLL